jgi:signal transduction histidine kinase/streptogramin lyase
MALIKGRMKALRPPLLLMAVVIPLMGLDPAREIEQFSYQTWQTGSGLPQNTIHGIVQTKDGYLWFATDGGVVRFDGYQFAVFDSRNTPALKSDNIRSLVEDDEGTLWIGTGMGIVLRRGNDFSQARLARDKTILGLHFRRMQGMLIVLADQAIQRTPGGSIRNLSLPDSSSRLTGAAAVGSDGTIWLGAQNGVGRWEKNRLVAAVRGLPQTPVNALLIDQADKLWAGTGHGLWTAEAHENRTFEPAVKAPTSESILSLLEDSHGVIWVGTEKGFSRLGKRGGRALTDDGVIALAEDSEGDLWVGTEERGVTILRNQKFLAYSNRDGIGDDAVRCVFEDHTGAVYLGTASGLIQLQNGQFKRITTASGLSSNIILSLGEDKDGSLLVGTPDGLNRIRADRVTVTTSADGLVDDFVRSIFRDADGSLWLGTRRGLSHEESPRHFKTYTQADGLGSELVGAILRDRAGDLWIGTLNGLSRMHNGRLETYRQPDGLSSNVITSLHEDKDGDLWVGTQDGGLNLRHDGTFHKPSSSNGLPDAVFGIAEDLNGEFWFASKSGIARANRAQLKRSALNPLEPAATVVWYGTSDGLRINESSVGGHPETWRARNGTLWFSTMRGAAALDAISARLNHVSTPVILESLTIDDKKYEPAQVKSISPGHTRFVFEYVGLSFASPQKIIYRYKLEGFDKTWVDAGAQRTASYTNIPPGRYHFRILARNSDGFWNETGAALAFRLEPHFFQTLWFYALVALALAGASYLIYRWRVREVEARFNAVLQERNRIGREIHDTLAQGFVGVSVQLEIVSRLLATSTETAREHLDQARVLVRESLSEARRSIWQLRSQSAENEDLATRLSKSATQAVGLSPVKLSMEVRGTYRPLGKHVEDELLRIGQEAVSNALRHAKCSSLLLELVYEPKKLFMTIRDDGKGFSTGRNDLEMNGHFGLKGMKERADQIHAKLGVSSELGKGTKISVEAPIK